MREGLMYSGGFCMSSLRWSASLLVVSYGGRGCAVSGPGVREVE